jgi:hypothetical protein
MVGHSLSELTWVHQGGCIKGFKVAKSCILLIFCIHEYNFIHIPERSWLSHTSCTIKCIAKCLEMLV